MDRSPECLAGGVIVGGFDGQTLPDVIAERLERGHLAGVTLFKRNVRDAVQVAALCARIADAAPADAPALISIDQEGGRVARLGPPVLRLPPMRALGTLDDVDLTRRAARGLGEMLFALGINLDFAPVADVDSNPANPIIGDRSFGREPGVVSRHVSAFTHGLREAGVLGCAKHFPGHGDTEHDSHLELPVVRHDRARLDAIELPPFFAAARANVASVMTAHVVYDGLVPGVPATLAPEIVTELLRSVVGFTGVCFSDDLHMKAVSDRYGMEDSAIRAIEAGCDGLLICTDPDSQERARLALAKRAKNDRGFLARLTEAHERMHTLRLASPPKPMRDPAAIEALLAREDLRALANEIAERTGTTAR